MVSISKIAVSITEPMKESIKPIRRLSVKGFQQRGALEREVDTRSVKELVNTIKAWANEDDVVKEFLPKLTEIDSKHYGVVADTIELAHDTSFIPSKLKRSLNDKLGNGQTALQMLLNNYAKTSKTNPNLFELTSEVINNVDNTSARCFLHKLLETDAFQRPEYFEHVDKVKPLVKTFANDILDGFLDPEFKNQKLFNKFIGYVSNPNADPEKVQLINKVFPAIESLPSDNLGLDVGLLVQNKVPAAKVTENLKTMADVSGMFAENNKVFDAVQYLLNNTNLY